MTGPNVKEAIEDLDIELISLGEVAGAAINIKKLSFHQNICEAGMTWYPTNYESNHFRDFWTQHNSQI